MIDNILEILGQLPEPIVKISMSRYTFEMVKRQAPISYGPGNFQDIPITFDDSLADGEIKPHYKE